MKTYYQEQEPKMDIKNTRDRFMDYCGNAWGAVMGSHDNLHDPDLIDRKEKSSENLMLSWYGFFRRIEMFIESDFDPTQTITAENLQKLLEHKDKDPMEEGVVDGVNEIYLSIIEKRK